jgi:putative transposase
MSLEPHRKRIRHFHEPGDFHELTFSCYQRMPLLTNNSWRTKLSRCIDEACEMLGCQLTAFVYMPEHVHLLVLGIHKKEDVSKFLALVKQPLAKHVRAELESSHSRLLSRLMVRERPGKMVFRYWQEGPGFDRNLFTVKAVQASLDYIHNNPVTRGLCARSRDWRWSSARYYESDGREQDELLPRLTRIPAEFWSIG